MSTSLMMRAILAATALAVAPAIAGGQAPQTKPCKDGTSSSRSTFACFGHGGVDTTHAARGRGSAAKHQDAEAVQAGAARGKHARSTAHKESKASAHHDKAEHRESRVAKKKQKEGHDSWLPWRHKKAKDHAAKKKPKHKSSSLPIAERPNGQPR